MHGAGSCGGEYFGLTKWISKHRTAILVYAVHKTYITLPLTAACSLLCGRPRSENKFLHSDFINNIMANFLFA